MTSWTLEERMERAQAAEKLGHIDLVLQELSAAQEENSSAVEPLSFKASILWRVGRIDDCAECCRKILERRPDSPVAISALGLCALAQGRASEAEQLFEQAIQRIPKPSALLLHNLGLAIQAQDRLDDAIETFRRAVQIDPSQYASLSSLAQLLQIRGDPEAASMLRRSYEAAPTTAAGRIDLARCLLISGENLVEAEEAIRLSLESEPENVGALCLQAMIRQRQGRFQEAESNLRSAISVDPTQVAPFWELFCGKKVTREDQPEIDALRVIASNPSRSEHDRRVANFALGKAHNDLGQFGEAMEFYHSANRLAKKIEGKSFEREAYRAETDRIMNRMNSVPKLQVDQVPGALSHIFVVGMFRSGTTLVEQIISSHPQVQAGGENPFWPTHSDECFDPETGRFDPEIAQALAKRYLLESFASLTPGKCVLTDKHPENHRNVDLLHAVLPNAKFIFCKRHPVDNCLSHYFTYFTSSPSYACDPENLVVGYRDHLRLRDRWREIVPSDRFLEISYDDLVAEPEPHIRRLIEFCGLPWDEQCMHPERNSRPVDTASGWQVRQPIYRTSASRWRKYEPFLGPFAELLLDE